MEVAFTEEPLDGPVASALVEAFTEEVQRIYPGLTFSVGPTALPEEFVHPNGRFLVAWDGGTPVACGGVKRLDDSTGEVKRVFVAPAVRGRGVGGRLLAALEDAARELGWSRLRLDTGDRQPHAYALFSGAGYREIGDYNENPYARHWFEKDLAAP